MTEDAGSERSASRTFHVMAKPAGPLCNLQCDYCFYLEKSELFPAERSLGMTARTLEAFVRQYIAAQPAGCREVVFSWQGGEPTLAGLDFYRRACELQDRYAPPGVRISNVLQTNGILLDDAWGAFLHRRGFLVGISIDGPEALHDRGRVTAGGRGSYREAARGLEVLQRHGVPFNTLVSVSAHNADHPRQVYDTLTDLGATFLQFIPIVRHAGEVDPVSVGPEQWGRFMNGVFDRWLEQRHVGQVFVQSFDMLLGIVLGHPATLCVHAETCGRGVAIEHNGDLFSCDHFVHPDYRLGSIHETPMAELLEAPMQRRFGEAKRDALPKYCRDCRWLRFCHGACPKDRILNTPDGESGLQYLCSGYQRFYEHTLPTFERMAAGLRRGIPAAEFDRPAAKEQT